MEDVRIQRKTTSGELLVSVTTSSVLLISPSDKRTSLVIGCPNAADVTLSLADPAVDGRGMRLQVGQSPLCLTLDKNGDLVTKGFYAIAAAGTEVICVWETSLEDK